MTVADDQSSSVDVSLSTAAWQEFIDAHFPRGAVLEFGDEDSQPVVMPAVVVSGLSGEFPVLLGYDYLSNEDHDLTLDVRSWHETERGGAYAAEVQLAVPAADPADDDGSEHLISAELRAAVPPVLEQGFAPVRAARMRAALEARVRAAGQARIRELLGGGTSDEAEAAALRAAVETDAVVAASRVFVPEHMAVRHGRRVKIESYWYDRKTGSAIPAPVSRMRQAQGREYTMERERGETRSVSRPGVASAYMRPSGSDHVGPMDDSDASLREEHAHKLLSKAISAGFSTDAMYAVRDHEGQLQWSDERSFQHKQIVDSFLARNENVGRDRKALIMGGLPAAGKTTSARKTNQVNSSDYMMLNPDDVKEEMAKRGMIPYVDGLTPMEASPLVHQEAGAIVDAIAEQALGEGRNIIWDVTMSNPHTVDWIMGSLKGAGYDQVDGMFVRVSPETSEERTRSRWAEGVNGWYGGDPSSFGGRLVPRHVVESSRRGELTVNEENFEKTKDQFSSWWRFDNDTAGREPVLVDSNVGADPGKVQG